MIYKIKHENNRMEDGYNVKQIYPDNFERWIKETKSSFAEWKKENKPEILEEVFTIEKTIEEKWQEIKENRNRKLRETDWTQVFDCPLKGNEAILAYRQALRDIPQTFTNPDNVIFPIKPLIIR